MSDAYIRQHTFVNGAIADGGEVEDEFVAIDVAIGQVQAEVAALSLGQTVPSPTPADAYEPVTVNVSGTGFITRPLADFRGWLGISAAGLALIDDASADAQLTTLGGTAAGVAVFKAASADAQLTALGGTSAGVAVFKAASAAAQRTAIGAAASGAVTGSGITIDTNMLAGRATAGTGALEQIPCTAAGRALLDDADAAAQRTTLNAATAGVVTAAGLTINTAKLAGRTTAGFGALEEIGVGAGLVLSAGTIGLLPGAVVQSVQSSFGTDTGITSPTPFDATIPQVTEGQQLMAISITPKSATNKLRVRASIPYVLSFNASNSMAGIFHIHTSASSDAIASGYVYVKETNEQPRFEGTCHLEVDVDAGTTSALTISLRAGYVTQNLRVNNAMLGGSVKTCMVVEEIAV